MSQTKAAKQKANLLAEQLATNDRIQTLRDELTAARERQGEIGRELRRLSLAEQLHRPNAVRVHPFIPEPGLQHFGRKAVTLVEVRRTRGVVVLNGERLNIPLQFLAIDDEPLGVMLGVWLT